MDQISCFKSICEVPHNDPYVSLPPSLCLTVNYLRRWKPFHFQAWVLLGIFQPKKLSSFFVWSHFWISYQSACLDWCQCFNADSAVGWAWKTWIWRWNGHRRRDKDSCKRWYIDSIDKLKWRMNICILHQPLCLASWLDFVLIAFSRWPGITRVSIKKVAPCSARRHKIWWRGGCIPKCRISAA